MASRFLLNPAARMGQPSAGLFTAEEYADVQAFFETHPELGPTPLHRLRGLARQLGVRALFVKDESARFGLNAFKIVGVQYAVHRLIRTGRLSPGAVVVCATAGNHGRAVARVARDHALHARVYVPADTAPARVEAIAHEGAEVVLVDGRYDDAVRRAAEDAARHGWVAISDTAWPGNEEIPRWIMAGYTQLLAEASAQWSPEPPPDIVLVQAGVGGLACAVASWLAWHYGVPRPFLICCEPAEAACALESVRVGRPVTLGGSLETMMAGLRCAAVSSLAWPILQRVVDAFVAIDDRWALEAIARLARPVGGDPAIVAGASGACGLGALLAIMADEALAPVRDACQVGSASRLLVFNTEGATDPELHQRVLAQPLER